MGCKISKTCWDDLPCCPTGSSSGAQIVGCTICSLVISLGLAIGAAVVYQTDVLDDWSEDSWPADQQCMVTQLLQSRDMCYDRVEPNHHDDYTVRRFGTSREQLGSLGLSGPETQHCAPEITFNPQADAVEAYLRSPGTPVTCYYDPDGSDAYFSVTSLKRVITLHMPSRVSL